jgi:hypothetical protein
MLGGMSEFRLQSLHFHPQELQLLLMSACQSQALEAWEEEQLMTWHGMPLIQ